MRHLRALVRPVVLIVCLSLAWVDGVLAGEWVSFDDVSNTNIVADEGAADPVGLTDEFEKDLISGDVDKDGDRDLIVARKVRFSNPGGKRNVLFMNEGGTFVDRTDVLIPRFMDLTDDRDVVLVRRRRRYLARHRDCDDVQRSTAGLYQPSPGHLR